MSPDQCCFSIDLHNPLIIVSVQSYLMLINHAQLMPLVLKQHLLSVYCFTIKQVGLAVIKRKAPSNRTLFCVYAALFLHFFAFKVTSSVMIFPPSSSFIRAIFFIFSAMGSGLLSSFEYPLVSNLFSTSFAISL